VTAIKPKLLRAQEAQRFVAGIENNITRRLIEAPYNKVLRRFSDSVLLPKADFDLAFFAEGLFLSFSCHDRIKLYLDGGDHRWFPELDDEIRDATFCPLPARIVATGRPSQYFFSLDLVIRRHEAKWLVSSIDNVATIQIVGVALAAFDRHLWGKPAPEEPRLPPGCPLAPLDLLFCAEVLMDFCSQEQLLRSILNGENPPTTLHATM
jgi:hypothetical protein